MLIFSIALTIIFSLITGFRNCTGYSIALDLNALHEPYFSFGIHNRLYIIEEREIVELTIGMIIINIIIEFHKKERI